ncbi:MAG: hypothetical protein ACFBSG_14645 [Leptolyngbyaceae cyanobacterium]
MLKPRQALLTLGTLAVSFSAANAAKADGNIALSFDLPPTTPSTEAADVPAPVIDGAAEAANLPLPVTDFEAPLPIPAGAENPPLASDSARPAGVYGGLDGISISSTDSLETLLPPPPPIPDYLQAIAAPVPAVDAVMPLVNESTPVEASPAPVAVNFGLNKSNFAIEPAIAEITPDPVEPPSLVYSADRIQAFFAGGTESLVARAVGSAEGTRTPEGHKNPAYFGHVDPGNGVWNLGTFSYQHGAATPEEADDKQLRRLQKQTEVLREKAQAHELELSSEELLNGIDLANQAPLAALDRGGYIEWLKQARSLGMAGAEAIVYARTRSFLDPDTQRWNAPGLGNNIHSISHDQERRAHAIARAISAFGPTDVEPESLIAQPEPVEQAPLPAPVREVVAFNVFDPQPLLHTFETDAIATEPAPQADISPSPDSDVDVSGPTAATAATPQTITSKIPASVEPPRVSPASEATDSSLVETFTSALTTASPPLDFSETTTADIVDPASDAGLMPPIAPTDEFDGSSQPPFPETELGRAQLHSHLLTDVTDSESTSTPAAPDSEASVVAAAPAIAPESTAPSPLLPFAPPTVLLPDHEIVPDALSGELATIEQPSAASQVTTTPPIAVPDGTSSDDNGAHKKASAFETDAKAYTKKTLASLDELQQRIRSEFSQSTIR